jgi:(2Fe-2S) ferredoxin
VTEPSPESRERLESAARNLALPQARRHLFVCALQTKPKCSTYEQSAEVWEYAKRRMRELGIATPGATGPNIVLRSKVDCFRVCTDGPIAVVYPEGTWYRSVTVEVMERILVEHLAGGRPVTEFVFARTPLFG